MADFTIERGKFGCEIFYRCALVYGMANSEAKALRDLLNREFPQEQADGPLGYCARCDAPILRTDIREFPQEQGNSAPESTNALRREQYAGTGVSIPEIDEFNAETWRLDEEAAHAWRRERVATAVLAAILSTDAGLDAEIQQASRAAVQHADALLAALDEPKP